MQFYISFRTENSSWTAKNFSAVAALFFSSPFLLNLKKCPLYYFKSHCKCVHLNGLESWVIKLFTEYPRTREEFFQPESRFKSVKKLRKAFQMHQKERVINLKKTLLFPFWNLIKTGKRFVLNPLLNDDQFNSNSIFKCIIHQ